jgi:Stage II sporulation protein E (SpoIIE)
MKALSSPSRRLLAFLLLGLLTFAAGVALARAWLPEWQVGELHDQGFYAARYRELAHRLGVRLAPGRPRVQVNAQGGPGPLPAARAQVRVLQRGLWPAAGGSAQDLVLKLTPDGRLQEASWTPSSVRGVFLGMSPAVADRTRARGPHLSAAMAGLLLGPGESLAPPARTIAQPGGSTVLQDVRVAESAGAPPEHLKMTVVPGVVQGVRRPGSAAESAAVSLFEEAEFRQHLPLLLGIPAVIALFFVLLIQHRIDLVNGGLMAVAALGLATLGAFGSHPEARRLVETSAEVALLALWVLVLWSAGESLLRSAAPGLAAGLDALRAGRLGPRGGAALLQGWSVGAGVAGLRLALAAAAVPLAGAWPREATVAPHPILGNEQVALAFTLPGLLAVALGLALRILPRRWAPWAAALAVAPVLPLAELHPYPLQLAAAALLLAPLAWVGARAGLGALLAASVAAVLLPEIAFAALRPSWFPVFLPVALLLTGLPLVRGFQGLRRPPGIELAPPAAPAFMRRLDEERRVRHEMDLLAAIQRDLQPEQVPALPGWRIAARSILATEVGGDLYDFVEDGAGRLWLAAGDVAGHGYSCAIAQAMTLAALASLISPERTPAEVLGRLDLVLRRGGAVRHFTSLALLRLDPKTGDALLANAGHPFPLLASTTSKGTEVSEIDLPGLPLGQGPRRIYRDLSLHLPPGSLLVFCSDGLFEAEAGGAGGGEPYGFERPREVLRQAANQPAAAVLDALLADWRRHQGAAAPADDTTVLVLERIP